MFNSLLKATILYVPKSKDIVLKLEEPITSYNGAIVVPKGYISDGASVPRVLWSIFPPLGKYLKAAVIHDFLYDYGHKNIGRNYADVIFLYQMKHDGVGFITRNIFYNAVKLFGKSKYRKSSNLTEEYKKHFTSQK